MTQPDDELRRECTAWLNEITEYIDSFGYIAIEPEKLIAFAKAQRAAGRKAVWKEAYEYVLDYHLGTVVTSSKAARGILVHIEGYLNEQAQKEGA